MKKLVTGLFALIAAGAATAHSGHGAAATLMAGLTHPLAWDHVLAMIAVGAWSVGALEARKRWQGPAAFVAAMIIGVGLGASGLSLAFTETAIALTVLALSVMLLLRKQLAPALGLGLVASFGVFHGLAHGAELPTHNLISSYALGLLVATVLLHSTGIALGALLQRGSQWTWRVASGVFAAASIALLAAI